MVAAYAVLPFSFIAPVVSIAHYHYEDCRRTGGAAVTTWVTAARPRILYLPQAELITSRLRYTIDRCCRGLCGTHIYSIDQTRVELVGFPPGVIYSGLNEAAVQAHYRVEEKAPWYTLIDELPRIAGKADFDPVHDISSSN